MDSYSLGVIIMFILSTAGTMYQIMTFEGRRNHIDSILIASSIVFVASIFSWISLFILIVVGTLYPIIKIIVKRQKEKEIK